MGHRSVADTNKSPPSLTPLPPLEFSLQEASVPIPAGVFYATAAECLYSLLLTVIHRIMHFAFCSIALLFSPGNSCFGDLFLIDRKRFSC